MVNSEMDIVSKNDQDENPENDEGTEEIKGMSVYLNRLIVNMSETLLREIEHSFWQNGTKGRLDESGMHALLVSFGVAMSDGDFRQAFNKMDVSKIGTVDFLQFMVYLSFEFELKRTRNELSEEKLSKLSLKLLPDQWTQDENGRQFTIKSMTFKPKSTSLQRLRTVHDESEYVAITEKGEVMVYGSDLKWKSTYTIKDSTEKSLDAALVAVMALPDFDVVCVSDASGKLRFYSASSSEFRLCMTIRRLPSSPTCLAYAGDAGSGGHEWGSKLAYGDQLGGVVVLEFPASWRSNPFRSGSGETAAPSYVFGDVIAADAADAENRRTRKRPLSVKKRARPFRVIRFPRLHPKRVVQVQFCDAGRSFASVSLSAHKSMAYCRIDDRVVGHVSTRDHGLGCVCAAGDTHVATGSAGGSVGLWDVSDYAALPSNRRWSWLLNNAEPAIRGSEYAGHNAAVWNVFYNQSNGRLYSVALDNAFKVWDVRYEVCLMTYDGALCPVDLRRFDAAVGHFNPVDQVFVMVTGPAFRSVKCGKNTADGAGPHAAGRAHYGDDDTHESACVRTLYNALYGWLISVSAADSVFAVWSPRNGELIAKRSVAHAEVVYCETLPVEITAAAFDPSGGLLVTAAANGSVHMWDPNTAACLNKLQTPSRGRITEVVWLPNKVLVTGFDKKITEFNDPLVVSNGKVWLVGHDEPVLSACVKSPSLLVTTTQAGVMGFWRLETGQLIKKYKARMKPDSAKRSKSSSASASRLGSAVSTAVSKTTLSSGSSRTTLGGSSRTTLGGSRIMDGGTETREQMLKRLDVKHTPREHFSAVAAHILRARPESDRVGTLLVATRNGVVQLWRTHKVPKYVAQFTAAHVDDDYVTAMASDPRSEYLITSFDSGYLKTWHVANFGVGHVVRGPSMPSLRLRFPFLLESFFVGRAERTAVAKNPNGPLLVNSYRAHVQQIRHVEYVAESELVVTSGADKSVRIWTLAGHYVGTLGTPWTKLPKTGAVNLTEFVVPLDVKREASFTTINVLMDGVNSASRSPAVWDKLESLRQQRSMEGKTAKRMLLGAKCPEWPLHEVCAELADVKAASFMDPSVVKIDESELRVQIFKYVPLSGLADTSVPRIVKLEQTRQERTAGKKKVQIAMNQ